MQNNKILAVALNAGDLHSVYQHPIALRKYLCISAALCPDAKELCFVTADGTNRTLSTNIFKSTDKVDIAWHKMDLQQLGTILAFGPYQIAIKDLIAQTDVPTASTAN